MGWRFSIRTVQSLKGDGYPWRIGTQLHLPTPVLGCLTMAIFSLQVFPLYCPSRCCGGGAKAIQLLPVRPRPGARNLEGHKAILEPFQTG